MHRDIADAYQNRTGYFLRKLRLQCRNSEGQKSMTLVAECLVLTVFQKLWRRKQNVSLCCLVQCDSGRHAGVARVSPVGFSAGFKFKLATVP